MAGNSVDPTRTDASFCPRRGLPLAMAQAGGCPAGSSPVAKALVGRELERRQPCALAAREDSRALGCRSGSTGRRWREGTLPLNGALVRAHPEECVQFGEPQYWKGVGKVEQILGRALKMVRGLGHFLCEEGLMKLGLFSVEKGRLRDTSQQGGPPFFHQEASQEFEQGLLTLRGCAVLHPWRFSGPNSIKH